MTYRECYQKGVLCLREAEVPEAELDARILLEHVCNTDYQELLMHGERLVEEEQQAAYRRLIEQRGLRIPLQQLTGEQDFCGLRFWVNRHVLIPRQDTEILVEAALKRLEPGMQVLDMCTGSGCILISLLAMKAGLEGTGVDISKEALEVAWTNGQRLLPEEKQPRWLQGDLFGALAGQEERMFDMLVSNPPYIPSAVIGTLMPEVREHEPRAALDGSGDGLLFYRRIVSESKPYLKENGSLLFEIGYDQGQAVKSLMEASGFAEVCIIKDYAGLDRVVVGKNLRERDV